MTITDPITARPRRSGFGWLTRIMPRGGARPDRFTPIDELPPYLLYDIGLTPDRLDRDGIRRR
jgi:hypothetical protein